MLLDGAGQDRVLQAQAELGIALLGAGRHVGAGDNEHPAVGLGAAPPQHATAWGPTAPTREPMNHLHRVRDASPRPKTATVRLSPCPRHPSPAVGCKTWDAKPVTTNGMTTI